MNVEQLATLLCEIGRNHGPNAAWTANNAKGFARTLLDRMADAGAGPVGEAAWHLGAMNDGLFIIDRAPGLTSEDNGPELVLNVAKLTHEQAQAIVDAHNATLNPRSVQTLRPVCRCGWTNSDLRTQCRLCGTTLDARPVDEPGEVAHASAERTAAEVFSPLPGVVERLTRERDAQYDENVNRIAAEGAAILRAETAETALAETQKRLDKLLVAAGKARTALAGFTSISDAAYALDVALAAASSEVVR